MRGFMHPDDIYPDEDYDFEEDFDEDFEPERVHLIDEDDEYWYDEIDDHSELY